LPEFDVATGLVFGRSDTWLGPLRGAASAAQDSLDVVVSEDLSRATCNFVPLGGSPHGLPHARPSRASINIVRHAGEWRIATPLDE